MFDLIEGLARWEKEAKSPASRFARQILILFGSIALLAFEALIVLTPIKMM